MRIGTLGAGITLGVALYGLAVGAQASVCAPTLAPRADGPQVPDTHFVPNCVS
jgi:hypothetical protein